MSNWSDSIFHGDVYRLLLSPSVNYYTYVVCQQGLSASSRCPPLYFPVALRLKSLYYVNAEYPVTFGVFAFF